MTEKKQEPKLGVAADGTTYVVEVPFDISEWDDEKPYLAVGMTAEEIRTYNPGFSDEEVKRHARGLARKSRDAAG